VLDRVRIVLVRPRRGGNVGAAARVMKNFGLADLVLVAPRTRVGAVGAHMAVHASDVLDARRTVPDVAAAVADCVLVVGTAGRAFAHLEPIEPRAAAHEVVAATRRGPVALVFGPEDHGLSNVELGRCQRLVRIPTAGAYGSLNLAQAVAVCAYELCVARAGADAADSPPASPRAGGPAPRAASSGDAASATDAGERAPATSDQREALLAHFEEALAAVGFLSRENPAHILADLRGLFARAGLTRRDVKIWRGIARQMTWAARRR